jgi:motility quorum-sensing regulator/GCU-specific mRNA interferase toxin
VEKGTPHCRLSKVHSLIEQGRVRITQSAVAGAAALGFEAAEIVEVVVALTTKDFRKSMTTYLDHAIWQDVYCPNTARGNVYLKLTVVHDVLVVSFKEL